MTPEEVLINEVIMQLDDDAILNLLDSDNYDLIKAFYQYSKIDINKIYKSDKSALGYCIRKDLVNSAKALIDMNAHLNKEDLQGKTAFEYASQRPSKILLKYMLQKYMFKGAVDESEIIEDTKKWARAFVEKENIEPKG